MTLFANSPSNACQAYVNLRAGGDPHLVAAREHCDELWREFAPLADADFAIAFPARLHERWFEMYLTVALRRAGLNVSCRKPGPDVLITLPDGRQIWIEATCATPGAPGSPDSVPPPKFAEVGEPPIVTDRPTSQMALRIRNSLSTKEAVFRNYIDRGIVTAGDVMVVAINVHAVHGLWADMGDLMMRSLYGVGDLVLTLSRDTGTIVGQHHDQLSHIERRSSGALVDVQPFIDGSMSHITAVIGSRADCANLPKRLGDDFALFPNLSAGSGWPVGLVALGEEWNFAAAADGWDGRRIDHIQRLP